MVKLLYQFYQIYCFLFLIIFQASRLYRFTKLKVFLNIIHENNFSYLSRGLKLFNQISFKYWIKSGNDDLMLPIYHKIEIDNPMSDQSIAKPYTYLI